MRRCLVAAAIAVALVRTASVAEEALRVPNRPGSLKFAAIGDTAPAISRSAGSLSRWRSGTRGSSSTW
jgi:hypothetical protein